MSSVEYFDPSEISLQAVERSDGSMALIPIGYVWLAENELKWNCPAVDVVLIGQNGTAVGTSITYEPWCAGIHEWTHEARRENKWRVDPLSGG
jgi:hypothetical protein